MRSPPGSQSLTKPARSAGRLHPGNAWSSREITRRPTSGGSVPADSLSTELLDRLDRLLSPDLVPPLLVRVLEHPSVIADERLLTLPGAHQQDDYMDPGCRRTASPRGSGLCRLVLRRPSRVLGRAPEQGIRTFLVEERGGTYADAIRSLP